MVSSGGRESSDLSALLLSEPHRFDFFQAVRLLERVAREWSEREPGRPDQGVGRDRLPEQEAVRFRTSPSLAFPTSEVTKVSAPEEEESREPMEMVVSFLGLVGANGVMPHHYTALLLKRIREEDYTLRGFLVVFGHRLISLVYRVWEQYRLPFAFERFRTGTEDESEDPLTWGIYCLAGMGTDGQRNRLEIADAAVLYYVGHFAHQPR